MLNKEEFIQKYPNVREGMDAYNVEGDKLGKVVDLEDDYLVIEKGIFFPKDFTFRYDDIAETRDGSLLINQHREDLKDWRDENYKGWNEYDRLNRGETSIPVREEELHAQKIVQPKGEVRVRKVVHTEMKQFTVPVTKEEVIVERRPVAEGTEPKEGEKPFKEEETTIPVSEERVEVYKKPVTKEEVHIKKEARTEEEAVKAEVRKEEVKVNRSDEDQKRKAA